MSDRRKRWAYVYNVLGFGRNWRIVFSNQHLTRLIEDLRPSRFTRLDRQLRTTLNDGYLGSRNDEERSEMRYVV